MKRQSVMINKVLGKNNLMNLRDVCQNLKNKEPLARMFLKELANKTCYMYVNCYIYINHPSMTKDLPFVKTKSEQREIDLAKLGPDRQMQADLTYDQQGQDANSVINVIHVSLWKFISQGNVSLKSSNSRKYMCTQ